MKLIANPWRAVRALILGGCLSAILFGSVAWSAEDTADEETPDPTAGAGPEAPWRAVARWDKIDEEATADIHEFTTDPKYITPLVSYIPEHRRVPSPRDVLGYIAGAEGMLTHPDQEYEYFEALAASTDRVQIFEMGETEEGRRMILVAVSDRSNMRNLDKLKGYTAALADSRLTDEAEAMKIIEKAKPFMHITAGLHSPETGPPEMVMELAYRLVVSDHPDIREIRDNVVTLITPVTEVDGRARVVEWYYRYLKDYDSRFYMPSRSPPYWGKYTYHDNNRDGIQMSQALTQNYNKSFFDWHPTYSLDLHESVPLLYVSGGTGPYNETLDPIVISEWQWIANWELTELNKQGLPGVWTWGYYTGWNPSYLLWVTNNHNSLGRFYETFGNGTAKTMERDLKGSSFAGRPVTSAQWYRANPPDEKVIWSLRNNTNYMQSGVLASLSLTARNGSTLLHNFWKKGANSIDRGRNELPHAYIIPGEQRAPDRVAYLINQLRTHGIEVHRASEDFEVEEGEFKAGDFVVRLDQPYGNFARSLLKKTLFPKDADHRPYDDVSWTLGKIYRVDTKEIEDDAVFEVEGLNLVEADVCFPGEVSGSTTVAYIVKNEGANTLVTARYRLKDFTVNAAEAEFEAAGETYPAGSWIIPYQGGLREAIEGVAGELMLNFVGVDALPQVAAHELDPPRLALYHNWVSTQNDGWVRFTLEQAGVPYEYINDDDIKAGDLAGRFDVIMMAHQGGFGRLKSMIHGRDPKFGPMPYTSEGDYASHGVIDASEDISGGFGFRGLVNLEDFLNAGGTMLLMGSAGTLATDSGLVRNVSASGAGVNTPGSAIQTKIIRADHPIGYGFDEVNHVFRTNAPVFSVPEAYEHWIVVQYGVKDPPKDDDESDEISDEEDTDEKSDEATDESSDEDDDAKDDKKPKAKKGPFLLTGFVDGQSTLERKAVVLDVPRSAGGRVIFYSFNPMHRFLNHGDHNYVYNAILNWNDMPDPEPKEHPGLMKD